MTRLEILGVSVLMCACASAQDTDPWPARIATAKLTLPQAIERAMTVAERGFVHHVELEQDGARLVFSVDVSQGEENRNVVLDVGSGEVVEQEREHEDVRAIVAACRIDLRRAIAVACEGGEGTPVEAIVRLVDGAPVATVVVHRGSSLAPIRVDAVRGRRLDAKPAEASAPRQTDGPRFTASFGVDKAELGHTGRNPNFVLVPGYRLVLEGDDDGDRVRLVISVLSETRVVDGVTTRVVEERETRNGELEEVSRNFFAISNRTNDVYYFGEEVDIYEDGEIVRHEGAWLAGVDGARFGLMMPGTPLLGARYYQEIAPGVAMDRAEIASLDAVRDTPAGRFEHCLRVREDTPLERGSEVKTFAFGIGLIQDESLLLVEHGMR
ncbi:MAG: PepSY domain-containing protein [Planctomycetes bacterium]|nr:PepSY domain-containing protein [Planctomycetota bacterium]